MQGLRQFSIALESLTISVVENSSSSARTKDDGAMNSGTSANRGSSLNSDSLGNSGSSGNSGLSENSGSLENSGSSENSGSLGNSGSSVKSSSWKQSISVPNDFSTSRELPIFYNSVFGSLRSAIGDFHKQITRLTSVAFPNAAPRVQVIVFVRR
ncbi:hypothetical protein BCR34DRAFT_582624 [Clohesyomyces aquaticus]|uniref:Uncharacterized protein n=1 Tax=Clohesyomyces aquaticus TaxID=1231657 RepID=A0A1Y2A984_9PLEO|nr:hypothetical protein BCR34DRAFT_582624 [Clohesyomyces aquaticus]